MPFSNKQASSRQTERTSSSSRQSERTSRRATAKKLEKQTYHPIFALYANEHANGRIQVDIKAYGGDQTIEDVLTLDEFLYFCEKLYYGETKITGSLWECDEDYASHSGNVRFTGDQLKEIKEGAAGNSEDEEEEEPAPVKKTKKVTKPKYEVVTEDEEEETESIKELPY